MFDDNTTTNGALTGLRVADFTRVLAGPYATMMLADLGADVIKIEGPEGDGTRAWKPPINAAGQSTYFAGINRNKRSIVCDLKDPGGLAEATRLAMSADIVIQNLKPGAMEKFGLGYAQVASENPRVVYCSVSGFGEGKGASLPGYDLLAQAVGGLMSITGPEGGEPSKVGVALVDVVTGMNAVIGIQAALIARGATGSGQHVQVNLLSSLLSALVNQASSTLETGNSPRPMGNAHPSIAPYESMRAADSAIIIAVGTDRQFQALTEILGVAELGVDPRFVHNEDRVARRVELRDLLEAKLREQSAGFWLPKLTARNIPAGKVNTVAEAIELATELGLNPVAATRLGPKSRERVFRSIANPIAMTKTPATYVHPPPDLGAHQGADWLPRGHETDS